MSSTSSGADARRFTRAAAVQPPPQPELGSPVPPGWEHNPTSPRRRLVLAGLALAGLGVATYLVLYQFRLYDHLWDPFDAETVVDATYPVPDAFAGVLAYGAELLLLALGGADRWRSLPWACLALGAVLTAGVVVSVALIVLQPAVIGAWCGFCLLSAALSFALFFLGIGEAKAAWQHVRRARALGASLGDAVWGRAAWASPGRPRGSAAATGADAAASAGR
jgi:Vitamin K epoxide reductase family